VLAGIPSQKERILDSALGLMAHNGVDGTSMRQLAADCGLNVATLYHYFPSKADLLRSVIEDRHYFALMDEPLPIDPTLPARARLERMLVLIWTEALREEQVWRLLLGESLRNAEVAQRMARDIAARLEEALNRWLGEIVPELGERRPVAAAVITGQSLGLFLEYLLLAPEDRPAAAERRARDLGDLLL
jgi:AcrR family transcriptional regulator